MSDKAEASPEVVRLCALLDDRTRERDLYRQMLERYEPDPYYTAPDHATVSGVTVRDQTAADLGIAGGPDDAYRSGPTDDTTAPDGGDR